MQERSVQAQEDAKLGMREGQGPDEEGLKQTYDEGGACMLAASNCVKTVTYQMVGWGP